MRAGVAEGRVSGSSLATGLLHLEFCAPASPPAPRPRPAMARRARGRTRGDAARALGALRPPDGP